jgi:hypothetical protein
LRIEVNQRSLLARCQFLLALFEAQRRCKNYLQHHTVYVDSIVFPRSLDPVGRNEAWHSSPRVSARDGRNGGSRCRTGGTNEAEGFRIVYAEAAARGVPSLASETGGAADAAVENANGILVAGPEPEQIAEGLRRFSRLQPRLDRQQIRDFALRFRRRTIAAQLNKALSGSA